MSVKALSRGEGSDEFPDSVPAHHAASIIRGWMQRDGSGAPGDPGYEGEHDHLASHLWVTLSLRIVPDVSTTLDVDSNETAYNEQLSAVQDALKTYGTDNIEGVSLVCKPRASC